jgi:hypothetical protein
VSDSDQNPKVTCVVPVPPVVTKKGLCEDDVATLIAMSPEEVKALSTVDKRKRTRTIKKFQLAQAEELRRAQQAEEIARRADQAKIWQEVEKGATNEKSLGKDEVSKSNQEESYQSGK